MGVFKGFLFEFRAFLAVTGWLKVEQIEALYRQASSR